jgi:hypothetical protein
MLAEPDPAVRRLADAVRRLAEHTRDRRPTGTTHDDADDAAGTVDTDDAVGFDPFPLLDALHRAGAEAVVIGQVAGILHGSRELTGDLDVLWDGDPAHAEAFTRAFSATGATLADDDGHPLPVAHESFGLPKVLFRTATASGDCCTPALPWGDLPVAEFIARADGATTAAGTRIRYLNRADLIAMRRAAGRPKDLRRAAELADQDPATGPDRDAGGR